MPKPDAKTVQKGDFVCTERTRELTQEDMA